MRAGSRTAVAMILALVCAQAAADARSSNRSPADSTARSGSTSGRGGAPGLTTVVYGFVWDANDAPIARANVRLRNVATGRAEASTIATETGEFTFNNLEGGTYVIEYIDDRGKVLAVGHVFSVAVGETVVTFIRLSDRRNWFDALLRDAGSTAAAVISSAASLGVTALAPAPRPVSAEF